ncbi:hypothetical protein HY745_10080, partial [Candidatus Desantisbacteria bacterium]|nr:hypothetical protein [Candidatus Desantisbacteria bacterium]
LTGELDLDSMPWAKRSISISNFSQGNASSEAVRVSIRKVSDIIKKDDLVRVTKRKSKKNPLALNLIQEQLVQGALLCIDAQTGYIKAMVGGYDFRMTPFNRAYQAWRQPGSAFKPFIYTAAIDNKIITPSSIIFDAPVSYVQFRTWKKKKLVNVLWTPANYHKTYNGDVTARYALAYSLNIPAIKVLERTGADKVISYAHKAGLTSINNKNLSLALGTSEVTLLSLTSAFSIFANQGIKVTPIAIRYIEGNNGSVLAQYTPVETPVLNENTAYIMASMMESVVKFGTAKKVKALNRPVAGKTGTTDRAVDAWFIGFTPEIITGMYVGLDDRTSMGQHASGEELVVPYWTEFMLEAVKDMPYSSFTAPDGLTFADVDPQTGLIAASACNTVNPEVFLKGTEPKTLCRHKERNLLDNKTKFTLSSFKKNTEEKENN